MAEVSGSIANLILIDIGAGIAPKDSKRVQYGPDELAFRKKVEKEWEDHSKAYPNHFLDIRE